jgi:hypothetical protein
MMKKINIFLIGLFAVATLTSALFYSCKKDKSTPSTTIPVADAKITGIVKSPNGQVIGAAKISAGTFNTVSDKNGAFTLKLKHGDYILTISTGGGSLFKTSVDVSIKEGQELSLDASQTVLLQVGALAYIPGFWDNIESIIVDSLGYNATAISVADLSNYSLLSGYDALFLNCGALEESYDTMDSLKYANLQKYLNNNGSIYASDYAVEFLTGDGNFKQAVHHTKMTKEKMHGGNRSDTISTCINTFAGGFIADSSLCTSKTGPITMVQSAVILDTNIINLLGHNTIDIAYNLGNWEKINLFSSPFHQMISDSTYGALVVRSDPFSSRYGGLIFYTTFHNEAQSAISSDVEKILQYFILNL